MSEPRGVSGQVQWGPGVERLRAIERLVQRDRNVEALAAIEAALAEDPARAKLHRLKSVALSGLHRFDDAIAAIDRALAIQPGNRLYRRVRVVALRNGRRYKEALQAAEDLLADDPDDTELLGAAAVSAYRLGEPEASIDYGRKRLEALERDALAWADRIPPKPAHAAGTVDRIAFSLWGTARRYCEGAIRNAELMPKVYPGWSAVYFLGSDVPADVRARLVGLGAGIVEPTTEHPVIPPMFWRFLVHDLPGTRHYLVRDCDSRIGSREAAAVAEWLQSGRRFHIIRDHPFHFELIVGGIWGGTAHCRFTMAERIATYSAREGLDHTYGHDQRFLGRAIWPWIRDDALTHDSYFDLGDPRAVPGGVRGEDRDHIGMGYLLSG